LFAQLLLGIPASSMASERAFSLDFFAGRILQGRGGNGDKIHGNWVGMGMIMTVDGDRVG